MALVGSGLSRTKPPVEILGVFFCPAGSRCWILLNRTFVRVPVAAGRCYLQPVKKSLFFFHLGVDTMQSLHYIIYINANTKEGLVK